MPPRIKQPTAHHAPVPETLSFTLPATGYARLPVVAGVSSIAHSTVWKWCAQGRFPKPVKIGPNCSAWRVSDVRAWLADPAAWQAANRAEG